MSSTERQLTIKQLIARKGKIVHAVNDTYATEQDYIEAFKEWLEQKCQEVEYSGHISNIAIPIISKFIKDELLTELSL